MTNEYESSHTEAAKRYIKLYEKNGDEYWMEKAISGIERELEE